MKCLFLSLIVVAVTIPCEAHHHHYRHCISCVQAVPSPPPALPPQPIQTAPPPLPVAPSVIPSPTPLTPPPIQHYLYQRTIQGTHSVLHKYYTRSCPNCQKGLFVPVNP